jgi:hypothetical protein
MNNYQDDPISTTVTYQGERLFGGSPVNLPARRGLILPLTWQLDDGVLLHYATAEVAGIRSDDRSLTLTMVPSNFVAGFTLEGYRCDEATIVHESGEGRRVQVHGKDGQIVLWKEL